MEATASGANMDQYLMVVWDWVSPNLWYGHCCWVDHYGGNYFEVLNISDDVKVKLVKQWSYYPLAYEDHLLVGDWSEMLVECYGGHCYNDLFWRAFKLSSNEKGWRVYFELLSSSHHR